MFYLDKEDVIETVIITVIASVCFIFNVYLAFGLFDNLNSITGPITGLPLNINLFVSLSFLEFALIVGFQQEFQ